MAERTSFHGVTLAEATRMSDYEFGDAIIKLERDNKNQTYHLHLMNKIDKRIIEKFKAYHKKTFLIKVYNLEYEL